MPPQLVPFSYSPPGNATCEADLIEVRGRSPLRVLGHYHIFPYRSFLVFSCLLARGRPAAPPIFWIHLASPSARTACACSPCRCGCFLSVVPYVALHAALNHSILRPSVPGSSIIDFFRAQRRHRSSRLRLSPISGISLNGNPPSSRALRRAFGPSSELSSVFSSSAHPLSFRDPHFIPPHRAFLACLATSPFG